MERTWEPLERLFQDENGYWLHKLVGSHYPADELALAHANFAAAGLEPALLRIFTPFVDKNNDSDELDEYAPANSGKKSPVRVKRDASAGSKRGSDASAGSTKRPDASAGSKRGSDASAGSRRGSDASAGSKRGSDASAGSKRGSDASAGSKRGSDTKREPSVRRRWEEDSHGAAGGSASSSFSLVYGEIGEVSSICFIIII